MQHLGDEAVALPHSWCMPAESAPQADTDAHVEAERFDDVAEQGWITIHQIRVQVWKNDMISGEKSKGIGVLI